MAEQIVVAGKSEIYVAIPSNGTPAKLGEVTDMLDPQEQVFFHNVPGDSKGGPQGPPIEVQALGEIHNIRLDMSLWDPLQFILLEEHNILATVGKWLATDYGTLLLLDNSIRLTIKSTRDASQTRNYPCCIMRQPKNHAMGTKWSQLTLNFEAHAGPPGHVKEDVLWDTDIAGLPV